ncbi:MAG: hypothetical protein ACYT04_56085 [Nostoc sp.]
MGLLIQNLKGEEDAFLEKTGSDCYCVACRTSLREAAPTALLSDRIYVAMK